MCTEIRTIHIFKTDVQGCAGRCPAPCTHLQVTKVKTADLRQGDTTQFRRIFKIDVQGSTTDPECTSVIFKVNMVLNVHRNHKAYILKFSKDGERGVWTGGGRGRGGGGRLYTPIATLSPLTRTLIPALRLGSDESHFNVSVRSDEQSHKIVSTNHNLFEGKAELKRRY